MLLKSILLWKI